LKRFETAASTQTKRCAWSMDLNRFIPRSLTRVGSCDNSARLFAFRRAVRHEFGRDACKPLIVMVQPSGRSGILASEFGIGSVGRDGSVAQGESRSRSSAYSRRAEVSKLLKIRVSMVRFRPWPPLSNSMIRNGFRVSPADYPWPLMADLRTIGKWVGATPPASSRRRRVSFRYMSFRCCSRLMSVIVFGSLSDPRWIRRQEPCGSTH